MSRSVKVYTTIEKPGDQRGTWLELRGGEMPKTWDRKDNPYQVIGRGWVGWHAQAIDMSSSGGTLDGYVAEAAEGALVYDSKEAHAGAFAKLVVHGPMVDPKLPPGGEKRLTPELRDAAARMLPGLSGGFETVTRRFIEGGPEYRGGDYIAVDLFERELRRVPGIKIGHVKDGQVAWEA